MSQLSFTSLASAGAPTLGRAVSAPKLDARTKAADRLRSRLLFVLLCGVVFVSMNNGLVKQAFNWSQVAYVILDIPWVLFLLVWGIWPRPAVRQGSGVVGVLLIAILVYSVLQIFNPLLESPFMAIGAARNRLLPILFFWVGKDLLPPRRANAMLLFCFCIAAAAALFGIVEWKVGLVGVTRWGMGFVPRTSLAWRTADGESVLRPLSIYQDAGIAALFGGAVLFCLTMVYAGRRASLSTWFARGCGVLCLAFIGVSGVRAAVLCAAGGLLAASLLSVRRVIPLAVVLAGGVGVLIATGAYVTLAERYKTILNPVDAYVQNRGTGGVDFADLLTYSPLGYGTGAASPANLFYAKTFGGLEDPASLHSDNGYADLFAEGGIPLVLMYLALLGCILWQAWKRRDAPGPARSVAHGVFVFTAILLVWSATALPIDWQPTNITFWLLVGSLFAVNPTHIRRASRPGVAPRLTGFTP